MNPSDPTSHARESLLSLTYYCPKGVYAAHCPFAVLGGLSDCSRRSIIDQMSLTEMGALFDLVPNCACPEDPRRAVEHGSRAVTG